jgi:hypothetical protein
VRTAPAGVHGTGGAVRELVLNCFFSYQGRSIIRGPMRAFASESTSP